MKPALQMSDYHRMEKEALERRHGATEPSAPFVPPEEPTEKMINAGLAVTAAWLEIPGSALTVNREKMRRRWKAMWRAAHEPS